MMRKGGVPRHGGTLKALVNIAGVLTLALGVAAVVIPLQRRGAREAEVGATRAAVQAIEAEVKRQALLGEVALSPEGWPATLDPEWFAKQQQPVPRNSLLSEHRPWVEVASGAQAMLNDPVIRADATAELASERAAFWYNPARGIVRARVPMAVSDRTTLELYNRVNGTDLVSLFALPEADEKALQTQQNRERATQAAVVDTPF